MARPLPYEYAEGHEMPAALAPRASPRASAFQVTGSSVLRPSPRPSAFSRVGAAAASPVPPSGSSPVPSPPVSPTIEHTHLRRGVPPAYTSSGRTGGTLSAQPWSRPAAHRNTLARDVSSQLLPRSTMSPSQRQRPQADSAAARTHPRSALAAPQRRVAPCGVGELKLKCSYLGGVRVTLVNRRTNFSSLLVQLAGDFGFPVSLTYVDADGDVILLSSPSDFESMRRTCGHLPCVMVQVARRGGGVPPAPLAFKTPDRTAEASSAATTVDAPGPQGSVAGNSIASHAAAATPSPSELRGNAGAATVLSPSASTSVSPVPFVLPPFRRDHHSVEAPRPIRWQPGQEIGRGASGVVILGLNLDSGELMAVKQLDVTAMSPLQLAAVEREVTLLSRLNHPHIIQYLGSQREEWHASAAQRSQLNIFLEFASGGSLRSMLHKFGPLQEAVTRVYVRQLLLGLEFLHRNGVSHRDLKAGNVLVASDGGIKLADFGASRAGATSFPQLPADDGVPAEVRNGPTSPVFDGAAACVVASATSSPVPAGGSPPAFHAALTATLQSSLSVSRTNAACHSVDFAADGLKGTPLWMAPEVIRGTRSPAEADHKFWRRADIWGVACTVIEIGTGRVPWSELLSSAVAASELHGPHSSGPSGHRPHFKDSLSVMYHIASDEAAVPEMPAAFSPAARDFLRLCLQRDAAARPDVTRLLLHPWVAGAVPVYHSPQSHTLVHTTVSALSKERLASGGSGRVADVSRRPIAAAVAAGARLLLPSPSAAPLGSDAAGDLLLSAAAGASPPPPDAAGPSSPLMRQSRASSFTGAFSPAGALSLGLAAAAAGYTPAPTSASRSRLPSGSGRNRHAAASSLSRHGAAASRPATSHGSGAAM